MQEVIDNIPPSEDLPSRNGNHRKGGLPDGVISDRETTATQPVSGPVPGQLEALLGDMPEVGLPAETEQQQKPWLKSQGNYREPGQRWEPTQLNSRHREIMRRLLEGATYTEISLQMGLHVHTIAIICTSQMFREELAKLAADADFEVIKRAEALSNEALDVLKVNMRTAQKAADRNKAAVEILGIGGYSKIEKKVVGVVNGEEVIKRLNEMRRQRIMGDREING